MHLSCDPASKFNRCRISIHFAFPAERKTATAHALLPLVMERGYADCPDMTRLTKKLAKLYGADLTVDARPMGCNHNLCVSVTGIKDAFALEGEALTAEYTWMTLLEKNGLINKFFGLFGLGPFNMINTSGAVVLGMVYNYLPFMILPIYTAMTKIDDSIVEAAQDLGCNVWQILFRVLVPLTGPGIATGITQVFVPAVSTFIISRMLGGGSNLLIGDLIELQFLGNSYNLNLGSAMSLVLMVIVLLCMSFTSSFDESEMEGVM